MISLSLSLSPFSLTHRLSLSIFLFLSPSRARSLSLSLARALSLSLSIFPTHTYTHSLTLTHPPPPSLSLSLSPSLYHTHTHTHISTMLAPTKNQEALTPSTHPQTLCPAPGFAGGRRGYPRNHGPGEDHRCRRRQHIAGASRSLRHRRDPRPPGAVGVAGAWTGAGGGGDCARGRSGARGWGCSPGEGAGNARREEPETPQRAPG